MENVSVLRDDGSAALEPYLSYVADHLGDRDVGYLPHPDGWVIYSGLGHDPRVQRFMDVLYSVFPVSVHDPI